MYYDELLTSYLGESGRYQIFIFLLVAVIGFPVAFNTMGIVFIAAVPEHWCTVPELENITMHMNLTTEELKNISLPYDGTEHSKCLMYDANYSAWNEDEVWRVLREGQPLSPQVTCKNGWSYSTDIYTSTAVSEWDLVCERSWLVSISTSCYMAGFMTGSIVAGILSDRYGRRPVYLTSLILLIVSSISLSFSPNFITFFVIRFLAAIFNMGASNTSYVVVTEIMGPSARAHAANAYMYFWAVGYLIFALFAFFIRDWRILQLVTSSCCSVLIVSVFFLPESPRWLYSKHKQVEGDKIVRKMAAWNSRELPDKLDVSVKQTDKRGFIWDLFTTPRLCARTLIIMSNWCVISFVYYGLSLNTSNIGGNDFVNFALAAGVEIPAYICCQLVLMYIGRRLPMVASMVIGGIALMVIIPIPKYLNGLTIALAIFGKFCLTAAFSIVGVVTLEVFPTVTRQAGLATGSFAARVGGITAPYVVLLNRFGSWMPMLLFGSLAVATGLLSLLLPETKGKNLPETVEEGEQLGLKTIITEANEEETNKFLDN